MNAVVLGGGIAGLCAAWGLQRAGARVVVLEAAPEAGGLAGGFRDRGYTFDFFSHRLWTRDQEVLRLVEEWTGGPLRRSRKVSRILLGSRLYNYPLDLRDLMGFQGLRLGAGALHGYLMARVTPRDPESERDFRGFMTARVGAPLYDTFFGPYTRKLTGLPPETLASDLAREAIPPSGLLRQLARRTLRLPDSWDDLYYPEGGFMTIAEGIARAIEQEGGEVRLRHRVAAIRGDRDRVDTVEAVGPAGPASFRADLVVSTLPIPALLGALDPPADPAARTAAAALRTRAMVVAYLGLRRERLSSDHWIYVPDPEVRFNRLSETINYSPRMAPPGRTGLCVEIACERGDAVWAEDDDTQIARVAGDLVRLGLLRSAGEVEAAWVRRFAAAYPLYTRDHRAAMTQVETALGRIANLRWCGRQAAFWYGSTAQGIRQALDLAADIAAPAARAA